jgi:hypothetical protein
MSESANFCREQVQQNVTYSNTTSARASSDGGTVRLTTFTVFQLMSG